MSHPDWYTHYIRDWETNEGGALISDPRLAWKIIPELEWKPTQHPLDKYESYPLDEKACTPKQRCIL